MPDPAPGTVYRVYRLDNGGNLDWRVTDPKATAGGAKQFLPNPVLEFKIGTLEHAIKATAIFDRWGGHLKTTNKQVRFNGGDWLTIPEIDTTPTGQPPELYYSQDNPQIEVPLSMLKEGINTLEGTCGVIQDANWGQWGLYSMILRVEYDPEQISHPHAKIVSPAMGSSFTENPVIQVDAESDDGVARVDVIGWYEGYDEDGDGHFLDWHEAYFQPVRGEEAQLSEHIGTVWRDPYEVVWNTKWIPDQKPRAIRLVARVQDSRGVWSVSEVVSGLTLDRENISVKMYLTDELPTVFGVRVDRKKSCTIAIPDEISANAEVKFALRTWHGWDGHHEPLQLNGHEFPTRGKNHLYDYDQLRIPASWLRRGENLFTIHSKTEHHMLEVLWPGPAILVRQRLLDEKR